MDYGTKKIDGDGRFLKSSSLYQERQGSSRGLKLLDLQVSIHRHRFKFNWRI
jgi:hypothetical protein